MDDFQFDSYKLTTIKGKVARHDYAVDVDAVASALLAHLRDSSMPHALTIGARSPMDRVAFPLR